MGGDVHALEKLPWDEVALGANIGLSNLARDELNGHGGGRDPDARPFASPSETAQLEWRL